jgi:hypothetical protein
MSSRTLLSSVTRLMRCAWPMLWARHEQNALKALKAPKALKMDSRFMAAKV